MRRRSIHRAALLALLAPVLQASNAAERVIKVVAAEFPPLTTEAGGHPGGRRTDRLPVRDFTRRRFAPPRRVVARRAGKGGPCLIL